MSEWLERIDRLRELEAGKLSLPQEILRDLDSFFLEEILYTDDLNEYERGVVIEHYLKTA